MKTRTTPNLSPIKAAVSALFEIAQNDATPEQIKQVAAQFDVETFALEGMYWDERERLADL